MAVTQLTTATVSICYGYRQTTTHATRDIKPMAEEHVNLDNVLKRLLSPVESEEGEHTMQL